MKTSFSGFWSCVDCILLQVALRLLHSPPGSCLHAANLTLVRAGNIPGTCGGRQRLLHCRPHLLHQSAYLWLQTLAACMTLSRRSFGLYYGAALERPSCPGLNEFLFLLQAVLQAAWDATRVPRMFHCKGCWIFWGSIRQVCKNCGGCFAACTHHLRTSQKQYVNNEQQ